MRNLLLLALVAAFPLTASAQWDFDTVFPQDTLFTNGNAFQGVAVDDDGTVFLQQFNTAADTIDIGGTPRGVTGIQIFNPDGTEVDASPLIFIDYADGTTPRDTLGFFSFINSSGATATDTRTGRGIRYCAAEDAVYISQFDTIFKIDADTYQGLAKINPFGGASISAVGVDENCNVTVQSVGTGGRSITQFDPDLQAATGTVGRATDFTRTVLVSPDGNTVFETAFENPYAVVYQRPDEFSAYDSLGFTFAGLRIEATAVNPKTGYYWVSSGNPLNGGNDFVTPGTVDDTLRTNYTSQSWYAFDPADLFDANGDLVLNPTPVDSILYRDPGVYIEGPRDVAELGRPRGISFTADGDTAYVVLYNLTGGAQRFIRGGDPTANEPGTFSGGSLEQNRPNPFSNSTEIRFTLDRAAEVSLRVFDSTGREVATLANGPLAAGPHAYTFDAGTLASGVYVYSLDVEGDMTSRRMLIVR